MRHGLCIIFLSVSLFSGPVTGAAPSKGPVLGLTVGINSTCPYGPVA